MDGEWNQTRCLYTRRVQTQTGEGHWVPAFAGMTSTFAAASGTKSIGCVVLENQR